VICGVRWLTSGPAARRSGFLVVLVGALAGSVLLAVAAHSSAAVATGWGPGVEAALPANAEPNPKVHLSSVSCPSAGDCAAVGTYAGGRWKALRVQQTAGAWGQGMQMSLPQNAKPSSDVAVSSVSCVSAGNCAAVGHYTDTSDNQQGVLFVESSGKWAHGVEAALPANAAIQQSNVPWQAVFLTSVSCPAAGECTAVGEYLDRSQHFQGLLLRERSGTWARGVEARLPANASSFPLVMLSSVSCASAGNCTAVGSYEANSSTQARGLLLDERSGKWARGVEARLPANADSKPPFEDVHLTSVSCASAGSCAAVGYYPNRSGDYRALLLDESSGKWARGIKAPLPANAASNHISFVQSVSCPSAGNCAAVGNYNACPICSQGLLLRERSGKWRAVEATLPANAATNPEVVLSSVSCPSAGNCAAVGTYLDSSNQTEGLLLDKTSGRWARGVEATLPANAATNPEVVLSSVSCASAGNCAAVGTYLDSSGNLQGLLLSETKP
jgi:hypothetical protein